MRKTLLIAAATLAAGVISSQAAVYSQNIVGYVNYPTPVAGANYLMAVPFVIGSSNGANEVFGTNLNNAQYSQVLTWNVNTATFTLFQNDSTSSTGWDDENFSPVPPPVLPPGQAFFFVPTASITNQFVGQVALQLTNGSVAVTNTTILPIGGADYFVGASVPYAGVAGGNPASVNYTDVGVNLVFPSAWDYTQVLIWNPVTSVFTLYQTDSSNTSTYWDDANFSAVAAPNINVGDGFIIVPSAANLPWTEVLVP